MLKTHFTMDDEREIRVLNGFKPFLRILKAFDRGIFRTRNSDNLIKNVFFTFCVACVLICHISIAIVIFWSFFDDKFKIEKIASSVPIGTCAVLILLTFSSLVLRRETIGKTINRLQQFVEKRKL